MFGRTHHPGRRTADAWQELRGVAADRAKDIGDSARHRLGDMGGEARHRTSLAWDALAGREPTRRRWPVVVAGIAGAAAGWGLTELYRRRKLEVDEAMSAVGNQMHGARSSIDERLARAKATTGSPMEKAKAAVGRNTSAIQP